MENGLSPKEQVELMLKRAKTLDQHKKEQERIELVPEVLVQEEEVLLPSLYEPVGSLSLVEDVEETKESVLARFSIDPTNYQSIKLNKESANRVKKSLGRMTTGAAATVPIICRGSDCSYNERCLDGDSLVLMHNLKKKKIKDIVIGDKLYSANKDFRLEYKLVKDVSVSKAKVKYKIKTKSGLEILATSNHPFACFKNEEVTWKTLSDGLNIGNSLLVIDDLREGAVHTDSIGDFLVDDIISIEFDSVSEVYDITVEDNHTFIAQDILNHNCPFYKENAAPEGEPCLVEVTIAEYWTKKYMEDLDINPDSISELHTLSRLVEIAILENRLTMYMSIHNPDLTMDVITAVDDNGNEIYNKASSIAFEQRERLDKSKLKILESLAATREKRFKLQINAGAAANQSSHMVNIKESLASLTQQLHNMKDAKVVNR